MKFTLHVWRQESAQLPGRFRTYRVKDISPDMSFLEMLEKVNRDLALCGEAPIAFDSGCGEGRCGACSMMINGTAQGPEGGCCVCELRMRSFSDGEHITIEPFRAAAFPVVRDLVVDRSSLERVSAAGGFVDVPTGAAAEAEVHLVARDDVQRSLSTAICIGCGACVASCNNASAALFVGAKIEHLASLPQGEPEGKQRVCSMVQAMDREGFGPCSNLGECEAVCPKQISVWTIADLNRRYLIAALLDGDDF